MKRAGLEGRGITFHSTRHTFASHYLEGGAVSDLKEILGHSNLKTTEIYAKAVDVRTRASVEALDYGLGDDTVHDAGNGRTYNVPGSTGTAR